MRLDSRGFDRFVHHCVACLLLLTSSTTLLSLPLVPHTSSLLYVLDTAVYLSILYLNHAENQSDR